jgi:hypothetical protein
MTMSDGWKDSAIAALGTVVLVLVGFSCVGKKNGVSAGGYSACNCACNGCRKHHDQPAEVLALDAEVRVVLQLPMSLPFCFFFSSFFLSLF